MTEKKRYTPQFHLKPPKGWLNDPNGLCQLKGVHHIFFQYSPENPMGGQKCWGHYETEDYLHYKFTGIILKPDSPEDRDGVYSGCAYVEEDAMYLYYTGNVKQEGDYDYIYRGREGNTILAISKDGQNSISKECLLRMEDYPENLSNHVRDPKVFCSDGSYYMVLGARTREDKGCVLLYQSRDKKEWKFHHFIEKDDFGYMWECPDLFSLQGEQYLSVSPQGLKGEEYRYQNVYQSGYFHAVKDLRIFGDGLGDFTEWDYGFDFYAPQTYVDEHGRRILIGWMGVPDAEYDPDPTVQEGWQHMLTLPRELYVDKETKRIFQRPLEEMKTLRKELWYTGACKRERIFTELPEVYELLLSGFHPGSFTLCFDQGFRIFYDAKENVCCFSFTDPKIGCGRTVRKIKLLPGEKIFHLRIFADTCCMEVYINDGAYVFTTKLFPKSEQARSLVLRGMDAQIQIYHLGGFTSRQNSPDILL